MMRCRMYVDGKLTKSSGPYDEETARRHMRNFVADWSEHLPTNEAEAKAMRGFNQGKTVTVVSEDETLVVTTEDHVLRRVNVPSK